MRFPGYNPRDPKNLFGTFIGGSLVVIAICLAVACSLFTLSFLKKEQQRINVSRQQLIEFFGFSYSQIAEEMWTNNLESISSRVAEIALQFGNAEYELFLADAPGRCVYQAKSQLSSATCTLPEEMSKVIGGTHSAANPKPILYFDRNVNRNIYMVPLYVGAILKGYLYVSLSDPYDFYRGGFFAMAGQTFVPVALIILLVWLLWLLVSRRFFIAPYLVRQVEHEKKEALANMAQQVAHDLKSPLATLISVTATLKQVPEERRKVIRNAVSTIRDIANTLLEKKKALRGSGQAVSESAAFVPSNEEPQVHLLSNLVDTAVTEKRTQFRCRIGVEIYAQFSPDSYGIFSKVQATEFKRVLSNVINNAVEAIEEKGHVILQVKSDARTVNITVTDDGKGIPPSILPKLGQRGLTFGKQDGSGLGLFHAKEAVKVWGGELKIRSKLGEGTTVEIFLPRAETPGWFMPELNISEGSTVAVLDDDTSVHQIWSERFERLGMMGKVSLIHFSTAKELIDWSRDSAGDKTVLYLCDYELIGQQQNGLDVIRELSAEERSVLVTSHFEEREIRNRCAAMGVKLIPKELAGFVPVAVVPDSRSREAAAEAVL